MYTKIDIYVNGGIHMRERNYKLEFFVCIFGGIFGIHKFIQKKYAQGILYFFTAGLFFFGWFIDIYKLYQYAYVYNEEKIKENEVIQSIKEEEKRKAKEERAKQKKIKYENIIQERNNEAERIKNMKKQGIVFCPKCHSTSITAQNKRLSIGRAIVGGVLVGGAGAVLGGLSSKKFKKVCLNCGHRWK